MLPRIPATAALATAMLVLAMSTPGEAQDLATRRGLKPAVKVETKEEAVPTKVEVKPKPEEDATTDADETAKKKETDQPSRGFLGDPKKFSRMGGWGSIGGMMSQFGIAKTALVSMPPVQEELKLTSQQKQQLRDWTESLRQKGEDMGKSMREQAGDPAQMENMPMTARIFAFTNMMTQVSQMLSESESGLSKILNAAQRKRLTQVALQMEGIAALAKPELAEAIKLSEEQVEDIQQILAQSRMMQMTTWMVQGAAMGRGPGGPQRPGQDDRVPADAEVRNPQRREQAKTAERESDPKDPSETKRPPTERELAFRKQFESLRSRNDQIQDEATFAVLKVLTKRQRSNFDKLLGPPFDPSAINNLQRPGQGKDAAGKPEPKDEK